jgi:TPR repeat protein
MQRISALVLGSLLTAGCAPVQFQPTLFDPSKPNLGVPVVDQTSRLAPTVVMREDVIVTPQIVQNQDADPQDSGQAEVFVPTAAPAQTSTFTVDVPPQTPAYQHPAQAPAPIAVKSTPVASKAPPAEPYDISASLERELAMEAEQNAPAKNSKSSVTGLRKSQHQDEINKLTLLYAESDVNAAYDLAKLLYQDQRTEEADTVLDFAVRNKHPKAMLLYSERLLKAGDKKQSRRWLQAAADAGNKEAKQKLTQ